MQKCPCEECITRPICSQRGLLNLLRLCQDFNDHITNNCMRMDVELQREVIDFSKCRYTYKVLGWFK